jgi:hypothetical protein
MLPSIYLSCNETGDPVADAFAVNERSFGNGLLVLGELAAEPLRMPGKEFLANILDI